MALTCAVPTVHHAAHSLAPSSFTALQGTCHHLTLFLSAYLCEVCFLLPENLCCLLLYPQIECQAWQLLAVETWGVSQFPSTEIECDRFIKSHHFRAMEDDQWREQLEKCLLTGEELLKLGKSGAFTVPVPRWVLTISGRKTHSCTGWRCGLGRGQAAEQLEMGVGGCLWKREPWKDWDDKTSCTPDRL